LTSQEDTDAQGIGAMLLGDIRQAFAESGTGELFSRSLVERLCAMTDRPWPEAHRGQPVTQTWLARRLRPFRVISHNVRDTKGEQAKGYEVKDFAEVWERYLAPPGQSKRPSVPAPVNIGDSSLSKASQAGTVGRIKNAVPVNKDGSWDAGTDQKAGTGPEKIYV